MSKVTAQDRAFADVLLDACEAYVQDDKRGNREVAVNTIAKLLADMHERAVSCASIRVEREYGLVQRALPAANKSEGQEKA